jgi:3-carboxy-cis,cis-muconate cycloisomerase
LVEAASNQARESGKHLREILAQTKSVTESLTASELDRLFAPESYRGSAEQFVDRVIADTSFSK